MNVLDFKKKKQQHKKISFLTCYDYPSARIAAEAGLDCLLVGDSVAMVVHGYPNTLHATMEMMVLHTKAVAKGAGKKQFIVADLPFLAHRGSREQVIENVKQLMQAGAHAIKIEGGDADCSSTIQYLVTAGVPVLGHIGLTPQSVYQLGGYRVQGKKKLEAELLLEQAVILEQSGCTALVLECILEQLAASITQTLTIPTIGIGAGRSTDGQILVWHDALGLQNELIPHFSKQFVMGQDYLVRGIKQYEDEVETGQFPSVHHVFQTEEMSA